MALRMSAICADIALPLVMLSVLSNAAINSNCLVSSCPWKIGLALRSSIAFALISAYVFFFLGSDLAKSISLLRTSKNNLMPAFTPPSRVLNGRGSGLSVLGLLLVYADAKFMLNVRALSISLAAYPLFIRRALITSSEKPFSLAVSITSSMPIFLTEMGVTFIGDTCVGIPVFNPDNLLNNP